MDEKRNAIFTVGILCVILLIFTAADLIKPDKRYSETENRMLASRPEASWEDVKKGSFAQKYETYVADQFIGRDKWISVKTRADILLGKKNINGVYLGKDDYLIERHLPEDFARTQQIKKQALLEKLVRDWNADVMLIPTADNVLTEKLPDNAAFFDQAAFLDEVKKGVGESHYIDAAGALKEHAEEPVFYRTDHHWTSLGAYYGYQAWTEALEVKQKLYSLNRKRVAAGDFLGTLHSKINLPMEGEEIFYFSETVKRPVSILYDMKKKADSFYEESYLETKNKYGFFLDDNHALAEIDTSFRNGKTLFLIKDSFANSLVPLLASHYEKIYVADLRYYRGSLYDLMEKYEPERGMDVLVVYNVIHFLEEFQYYE